jgi:glycolate oxidase
MFRYAVSLGGTLTGEHGVGLLKRRWLEDELGPVQWKIHWGIKKLFDPQGILNPGKVFDPRLTDMAASNEEFVAKQNHRD